MNKITRLIGAGAILLGPALGIARPSLAVPPSGLAPHHETGQLVPGIECEDGIPPGNSAEQHGTSTTVPGSAFAEDSVSGAHYAGEQAGVNDKNTSSVSQYDIACFRGPDRPQPE